MRKQPIVMWHSRFLDMLEGAMIIRIAIAAAALSATIAAPAVAACDPGEREIRFDHVGPAAGNAVGEGAQTLAWLVNDRLDGRACMTVTPGAANHTEATVTDALREGVFEMGAVGTGYLGEISPRFLVFDLPFLFDNIAAVLDFQHSGTGEDLLHEARGEGLEGLAFWLDGFKQMGATRPVSAPADLSDLRMVASGSEVGRAAIEAMSAEPVAADEGA